MVLFDGCKGFLHSFLLLMLIQMSISCDSSVSPSVDTSNSSSGSTNSQDDSKDQSSSSEVEKKIQEFLESDGTFSRLSESSTFLELKDLLLSPSSTPSQLTTAFASSEPIFAIDDLEGFEISLSQPIFIEGTGLLGVNETCANLEYSNSAISIADLVKATKDESKCGDVQFNLCIKLTAKDSNDIDEKSYALTPLTTIQIPCAASYLAKPQIELNDRRVAYTNTPTSSLSIYASNFVSRFYATKAAGCGEDGSWLSSLEKHDSWAFDFSEEGQDSVFIKTEGIFGDLSECFEFVVSLDQEPPQDPNILVGSSVFRSSANIEINLSSSSSDVESLFIENAECSQNSLPGENSQAFDFKNRVNWQLNNLEGQAQKVAVYFVDHVGNTVCVEQSFILDTMPPVVNSISVDSPVIASNNASLNIDASGADEMYVSNESCLEGGVWQTFKSPLSWDLTAGDGPKNVYVTLRDAAGYLAPCSEVPVIVDSQAPVLSNIDLVNNLLMTTSKNFDAQVQWPMVQDESTSFDKYELGIATSTGDIDNPWDIVWQETINDISTLSTTVAVTNLEPYQNYHIALKASDVLNRQSDTVVSERSFSYHQPVVDIYINKTETCIIIEDDSEPNAPVHKVKCLGSSAVGVDGKNVDGTSYVAGTLESYGANHNFVKLPYDRIPGGISQLALGLRHRCALGYDSTIRCWGNNGNGMLGLGQPITQLGVDIGRPLEDPNDPDPSLIDIGTDLPTETRVPVKLCAQEHATCALVKVGTVSINGNTVDQQKVLCWGKGSNLLLGTQQDIGSSSGQMGANLEFAKLFSEGTNATVTDLVCGRRYSCVLIEVDGDSENKVKCWGDNSTRGQLGHALFDPTDGIPADQSSLNTMGDEVSEVGDYGPSDADPNVYEGLPYSKLNVGRILQIATAWHTACVLNENKEVYCWGLNNRGQLGLDNSTIVNIGWEVGSMDNLQPVRLPSSINSSPETSITKLFAGTDSFCVIIGSGLQSYCWGSNHNLMFGIGNDPSSGSYVGDGLDKDGYSDPQNPWIEMGDEMKPTLFMDRFMTRKIASGQGHLCGVAGPESDLEGLLACYGAHGFNGRIEPLIENGKSEGENAIFPQP